MALAPELGEPFVVLELDCSSALSLSTATRKRLR